MIGSVIGGKYEIVRLLGEGGMGAVYEARVDGEERRCAVKVINDEAVAQDEVLITRFEREAHAAQKVLSPHIVEIFDAGHDDDTGHPYMVMEMLAGENALEVLKRIGPLPPALAVRVGIQTCRGLAKAHGAGVVHRDIKPANLFLAEDGDAVTVKLLDFGVAKFKMDQASDSDNESLTRTGSMLGSPMYMSPEQARGLKTIDHRADIWSMGVVMHQLLSGRVPYQDIDGLGELIITICSDTPPLVSEAAPWVSSELAQVLAAALQLNTADRYQSASDMADALQRCLGDAGSDGWMISKDMIRPLEEPDKVAAATLTSSAPGDGHDATVALDGAAAGVVDGVVDGVMGAGGTVALSPEELAEAASRDRNETGRRATADEPAPSEVKRRDARALDKHRDAQRAAIDAARLAPKEGGGVSNVMLAAVIGCVLACAGLVYAYVRYAAAAPTESNGAASAMPSAGSPPDPSAGTAP